LYFSAVSSTHYFTSTVYFRHSTFIRLVRTFYHVLYLCYIYFYFFIFILQLQLLNNTKNTLSFQDLFAYLSSISRFEKKKLWITLTRFRTYSQLFMTLFTS